MGFDEQPDADYEMGLAAQEIKMLQENHKKLQDQLKLVKRWHKKVAYHMYFLTRDYLSTAAVTDIQEQFHDITRNILAGLEGPTSFRLPMTQMYNLARMLDAMTKIMAKATVRIDEFEHVFPEFMDDEERKAFGITGSDEND